MKLIVETFELLIVILMVIALESDSSGFNTQCQVIVQAAALCSHAVRMRGGLL